MGRLIVAAGLGGVLGLAIGFAAFSMPALPPPVQADCPAAPACPRCAECPAPTVQAAPAPATVPTGSAGADCSALQAQVAELEAKLAAEKAKTEGTRRPFPADLEAKYSSQSLHDNFHRALKEAGFDGDVTSVDCSEYPCIVFGSGFGATGDSVKLKKTAAFEPYTQSNWATHAFNTKAKDPKDRFFGMALFPPTEKMDDDLNKRMKFRMDQMWEATRPKEK